MKKNILLLLFVFCLLFFTSDLSESSEKNNIHISVQNGLYVIKIPKERNSNIYPYVTKSLVYNRTVYEKTNAELVINAGYFDANNEATASYVIINGKVVLNPKKNYSLMHNKTLLPHLSTILNRTEFRVLNCDGVIRYDIEHHEAKAPYKCTIVHSIQAGPMLYPHLKMGREYFVAKDKDGNISRDSIHALKKCARTVIGLKNGDVYIIIADIYHKKTLPEMYRFCKKLGLDKAMNFDGGGSTSLNYRGTGNPQYVNFEIVSDKNITPRKLKSFLVIE